MIKQAKLYSRIKTFALLISVITTLIFLFSGYINTDEIIDFSHETQNKNVFLYTVLVIFILTAGGSLNKYNIISKYETLLLLGFVVLIVGLLVVVIFIIFEDHINPITDIIPALVGYCAAIVMSIMRFKHILSEHFEKFK